MKITTTLLKSENIKSESIILGVFEDFQHLKSAELPEGFERQIEILRNSKSNDFKGKQNEIITLYSSFGFHSSGPKRLIIIGLGQPNEFSFDKIRDACGTAGSFCRDKSLRSIGLILPDKKSSKLPKKDDLYYATVAMIEGILLGAYRFDRYKSKEPGNDFQFDDITIHYRSKSDSIVIKKAASFAEISSEIAKIARDLSNTPSNHLTPSSMAETAKKVAGDYGLKIKVLSENSLRKQNLNGILTVGKGSTNPPNMIILEYIPKGKKTIGGVPPAVFIGKGVTFDSGGISLKPREKMDQMKHDMGGGAAVIAALAGLSALKVPMPVVGIIPAVENMPSGSATKPGDIIQYRNGKSIEVLNTDAEGRLILADALSYAKKYNPEVVVDIATLTGACVVALGHHAAGLMGNYKPLLDSIEKTSELTGEKVWKLPLWQPYKDEMKGDIADIKNVASREGGAINAAAFLLEFVEDYKWAHLDIAGTAWVERSKTYMPKGATGFGSRILLTLGKNIAEKKLK